MPKVSKALFKVEMTPAQIAQVREEWHKAGVNGCAILMCQPVGVNGLLKLEKPLFSFAIMDGEVALEIQDVIRRHAADKPAPCHHEELDMDGVCKGCGLGGAPSQL